MRPGSDAHRVVVGIGNPDRGDDGVGRAVVRRLRGRVPADVQLLEYWGEPATLVGRLDGAAATYLVDAALSGAAAGLVRRLDANAGPLPSGLGSMSSHGLGAAEAIELARALSVLPPVCTVFAIEAEGFEPGTALSPAVEAAADEVAEAILRELAAEPGDAEIGMHEASLMAGLMRQLDEIARREGALRVTAIQIRLGALSHLSPAHFAEHFSQAAAGTAAEGARLDAVISDDIADPAAQGIVLLSVEVET